MGLCISFFANSSFLVLLARVYIEPSSLYSRNSRISRMNHVSFSFISFLSPLFSLPYSPLLLLLSLSHVLITWVRAENIQIRLYNFLIPSFFILFGWVKSSVKVKTKDKKPSFAGGKQWIGAIEVSIVLQAECDVCCYTFYACTNTILRYHASNASGHFFILFVSWLPFFPLFRWILKPFISPVDLC